MEYRLEEPLVDHIGGVDKAVELLEVMRVSELKYWSKQDVYGKTRAANKVVGFEFKPVHYVDWKTRDAFCTEQLERAIQQRLSLLAVIVSPNTEMSYHSPIERPVRRAAPERYASPYWDDSPPLVIKYMYDDKVKYVMGKYMYSKDPAYPDQFHLEGHGGNWQDKIIGWAYA